MFIEGKKSITVLNNVRQNTEWFKFPKPLIFPADMRAVQIGTSLLGLFIKILHSAIEN